MIHLVVRALSPLLLAATGGLVTEVAGTLNIGLEGLMIAGAFTSIATVTATGSVWLAILATVLVGAILGAVFISFGHRLKANVFITGLAINLLAVGITAMFSNLLFDSQGVIRPGDGFHIPVIGTGWSGAEKGLAGIILGQSMFVPLSWMIALATGLILRKTRFGLGFHAAGLSEDTLRLRGGRPELYRGIAIIFSGITGALAGSALALELGVYVPNMSAGRGWIALVIVLLARKHIWGVVAASILFSFAEYAANALQGNAGIPRTLALAVPYIITLVSMVLFAIVERTHSKFRSR